MNLRQTLLALLIMLLAAGCQITIGGGHSTTNTGTTTGSSTGNSTPPPSGGQTGIVSYVVDGDTIEVRIGEVGYRVRYVGVNTPESDEVCYQAATDANAALVQGQTVTLVQDESNTDRYGRLLRYVYVGNTFVNAELVRQGYAEVVSYPPDTAQIDFFRQLETNAAAAGLGCHPTGIFNDGSFTR